MNPDCLPCPNPECRHDKTCTTSMNNVVGDPTCGLTWWVVCLKCHYQGPKADTEEGAIRAHNAIASPVAAHEGLVALVEKWRNKRKAGSTDLIGHGMRQAECACADELEAALAAKAP